MKALDLTTEHEVWACVDTSKAREVARMLADHDVGAIPVLDQQGRLEGIVTDRDICCRVVAAGRSFETPVREIMSVPVQTVGADAELPEIESVMRRYKIRRLPVVDESNRLQGFISFADLARHCHSAAEEHELVGVLETVSSPG